MAFENIIVTVKNHIGTIRLNRPTKLNALNSDLLLELMDALQRFEADSNVRVAILTGSDKVFSAGADIKEMGDKSFVDMFGQDGFGREADAFARCRKPIIAAVSGAALGGGCEVAMMCDIIIASETAVFGQPEINIGVMPGLGGTQRLTRAVGKYKSMEMNLTGRRMNAEEAERSGLATRVVPVENLMDEAMSVAAKIAAQPPLAVMAVKEAVNSSEEISLRDGLLLERRLFHSLFATDDRAEGMQAFVEKRKPHYRGR